MHTTSTALHQRIALLRWALPLLLGILAVLYEVGPGRWIHDGNISTYFDLDIAFYGLAIPLVAFATLVLLGRWLDDKEKAEKQARTSEQRLIALMTASADAILSVDLAGHIETWNRQVELLFGPPSDGILGKTLAALVGRGEAAEVEFHWLIENVQRDGVVRDYETTCVDRTGREMAVEITATCLTDTETGHPLSISLIMRDTTDRRHRELEIRRLNATLNERIIEQTGELARRVKELARANEDLQKLDQTRTEFVSVVVHQIRAPLTNMFGAIDRMQTDCQGPTSTCSRMFIILEQQIGRLERLVKDVLSAARLESGELVLHIEPISLMPVIQQVIDQTRARHRDRSFKVENNPGLPLVFADRDRVAEVLANLLDNADKYSPRNKDVIINIRATQTEVTLSVRDFGVGLRQQDIDRVFEKFYRADNSDSQPVYGYGLGLYICRQLVNAQQGRIWAENAADGGARFTFSLPTAS